MHFCLLDHVHVACWRSFYRKRDKENSSSKAINSSPKTLFKVVLSASYTPQRESGRCTWTTSASALSGRQCCYLWCEYWHPLSVGCCLESRKPGPEHNSATVLFVTLIRCFPSPWLYALSCSHLFCWQSRPITVGTILAKRLDDAVWKSFCFCSVAMWLQYR